jgi:hypothetical protein
MDTLLMTLIHITQSTLLAQLHDARPIDVLNTLAILDLLLIYGTSRRPGFSTDANCLLLLWASSVSTTLCWLLGIAVLSDLRLL